MADTVKKDDDEPGNLFGRAFAEWGKLFYKTTGPADALFVKMKMAQNVPEPREVWYPVKVSPE